MRRVEALSFILRPSSTISFTGMVGKPTKAKSPNCASTTIVPISAAALPLSAIEMRAKWFDALDSPPNANAGADFSVNEGQTGVTLNGACAATLKTTR